jgi:hypothetical protein
MLGTPWLAKTAVSCPAPLARVWCGIPHRLVAAVIGVHGPRCLQRRHRVGAGEVVVARYHCNAMPGLPRQCGGIGGGGRAKLQAGAAQSIESSWMDRLNNQAISGDHVGCMFKRVTGWPTDPSSRDSFGPRFDLVGRGRYPSFCTPGAVANACSRCRRILAEAWLKSLVAIASMIATCSRHQSRTRRLFA